MHNLPRITFPPSVWNQLVNELHRRTEGFHESGAFFLGKKIQGQCEVSHILYYEELDPHVYDSGVVILHAEAFGRLWQICAQKSLEVVGDVHVHEFSAQQSLADRRNPMIAQAGHLALILPYFASLPMHLSSIGIYEYLGDHRWRSHGGVYAEKVIKAM